MNKNIATKNQAKNIVFSKTDGLHAALNMIPSFILILSGNLTAGIAFALGTIPASQLGVAPNRKKRVIFSLISCVFGLGIIGGSLVLHSMSLWLAAITFFIVAFLASDIAAKKPIGIVMLAFFLPALAVGYSYNPSVGLSLGLVFILGSLWSGLTSMLWPESKIQNSTDGAKAFVSSNPKIYGVLLGLTASIALVLGTNIDPVFIGWTATSALLIMRPLSGMVGLRGLARTLSTIIGTLLAIITVQLDLPVLVTALLVSLMMIFIIGTRLSRWYIVPMGTAFLILTLQLYEEQNINAIRQLGYSRILDNILGAAIALFFGLLVPLLLMKFQKQSNNKQVS